MIYFNFYPGNYREHRKQSEPSKNTNSFPIVSYARRCQFIRNTYQRGQYQQLCHGPDPQRLCKAWTGLVFIRTNSWKRKKSEPLAAEAFACSLARKVVSPYDLAIGQGASGADHSPQCAVCTFCQLIVCGAVSYSHESGQSEPHA